MSSSTLINSTTTGETAQVHRLRWQAILFWAAALALFLLAAGMRLYNLGLLFDRDGYDEGVYWQSLRAMSAGHPLYQQIFYSQPPFFLLSAFPSFALLGGTLWSGRLGIALVSLLGMLGAFLLGKALAERGLLNARCRPGLSLVGASRRPARSLLGSSHRYRARFEHPEQAAVRGHLCSGSSVDTGPPVANLAEAAGHRSRQPASYPCRYRGLCSDDARGAPAFPEFVS